ncbi:MAG: FeoB-associated Cys-rich membrane protein [Ruminococcaceae bacterium]|nr:FeoB-associated Cys-rich membrane protein [Oscillospiraceae bacterium]
MPQNVILIVLLLLIVGLSGFYIYRSKKRGQKCIGCPYANSCAGVGNCNGNSE